MKHIQNYLLLAVPIYGYHQAVNCFSCNSFAKEEGINVANVEKIGGIPAI